MMKQGFSLVELSIVLVILGLLTGGILTGQNLIKSAELRQTIKQREEIASAVLQFRVKYFALPGDLRNGTDFGFVADGNGDGMIGLCGSKCEWGPSSSLMRLEEVIMHRHLLESGIYPAAEGDAIEAKMNGYGNNISPLSWGIAHDPSLFNNGGDFFDTVHGMSGHVMVLGDGANFPAGTHASLKTRDAFSIDQKLDDGFPFTGSVIAVGGLATDLLNSAPGDFMALFGSSGGGHEGVGPAGGEFCINNSSNSPYKYNVAYDGTAQDSLCVLMMKASF